jgi:phage tail tape-measure protein
LPARLIIAPKSTNFRRKAALSKAIQFNIEEASLMKLFALSIPLVAVAAAVAVAAGGDSSSCGYNKDGTYMSADGQVSAFGTMTAAAACAADGKLPNVVAARLGVFGGEQTRQWSEEIKQTDAEAKQQRDKEDAGQA